MEGERHDTKRQGEADGERSAEKAMVEGRDGRTKEGRGGRAARTDRVTATSRRRLLAISRHSPRTLATWEGFVKDGLKNIRTKKRRREEPAEDAVT